MEIIDSNVTFVDLPNEILFLILNKLDNMDVLYSLFNINDQRLHRIVEDETFTKNLNFVSRTSPKKIFSISCSIIDRFCLDILPQMGHYVRSLVVEGNSMERILRANDYPSLTSLHLFNFNDQMIASYFTDQSPFRKIFEEQITDLLLVYEKNLVFVKREYPGGVHRHIIKLFSNLQSLSIDGMPSVLSLSERSLTDCFSSTLSKLNVKVRCFGDCLALLDGRLKHLTMAKFDMGYANPHSSSYNMDDLPNMKSFSLTCICLTNEYDLQVVPLLRRMRNIEELTLNISNRDRTRCIDGTQMNNELLSHLPRMNKFQFHISTEVQSDHLVNPLSNDEIERSFANIGYDYVCSIIQNDSESITYQIFTQPFIFERLFIGNEFPSIVFSQVTYLTVSDDLPFNHEFFVRIARSFPLLKELSVISLCSPSKMTDNRHSNEEKVYSIIEYPHLISLGLECSHIDCVEQFLDQRKTSLPCLSKLEIDYDQLIIVTENFTRRSLRPNCSQVKKLILREVIGHSKEFYLYFPLL